MAETALEEQKRLHPSVTVFDTHCFVFPFIYQGRKKYFIASSAM